MRIEHITDAAVDYLLGRVMRRVAAPMMMVGCTTVAGYYLTVAGTLELDAHFTTLNARLILAAVYAAIGLISLAVWMVPRSRAKFAIKSATMKPALENGREMQVAMLVEAVMLGNALARKGQRAS